VLETGCERLASAIQESMITVRGFSDDKVIADQYRYLLGTPQG